MISRFASCAERAAFSVEKRFLTQVVYFLDLRKMARDRL